MEEPIQVLKRRVHTIGHSKMVVLPKWWIQDRGEVKLEVYPNKIIIRRRVEE